MSNLRANKRACTRNSVGKMVVSTHEPYGLILGQKNYSSWSMRVWLLMRFLELPFEAVTVPLYTTASRAEVKAPRARAQAGRGRDLGHALDIRISARDARSCLAHRPVERARARSLCGEVHSGLSALREAMPVNTRARDRSVARSGAVDEDINRLAEIWSAYPADGTRWLFGEFGEFGGADIMFAPVATRFQTYGVELPRRARAYQLALLSHPLVDEWLSLGAAEADTIAVLEVGA